MIVDSSVIVKWLNRSSEKYLEQADQIMEEVLSGKITLLAPELAKYEVGNVLLLGKKLIPKEASSVLVSLYLFPIKFIGETKELAKSTFEISHKLGITYYDAAFMALAKEYNTVLVTDNVKHQGKTKEVKVIPLVKYGR